MKTDDEIARQYDEAKAQGNELETLVPVRGRAPRKAESIYSLRFTSDEMRVVAAAARAAGLKLSQFIRNAALDAAQPERADSFLRRTDSSTPTIEQRLQSLETEMTRLQKEIASLGPFANSITPSRLPSGRASPT